MKSEIYAAEIDLTCVRSKPSVAFNDTQTRAYLAGLSTFYEEVVIVNNATHLFLIALGQSPMLMIKALNEMTLNDVGISILSSAEAMRVLIKIAKGERWNIPLRDLRTMLIHARTVAAESDCLGETLYGIMEAALMANSQGWKMQEEFNYNWLISHPSISGFDRSQICLN